MFPLTESGLSSNALRAARIISFLWQNDQWIVQLQSFPEFSSAFSSGGSSDILHHLSRIAALTQVKGKDFPKGIPPVALEAFKETLKPQQPPSTPVCVLQRILRTLNEDSPKPRTKSSRKRARRNAAKKAWSETAMEPPQKLGVMEEELEEGEIREVNGGGSREQVSSAYQLKKKRKPLSSLANLDLNFLYSIRFQRSDRKYSAGSSQSNLKAFRW